MAQDANIQVYTVELQSHCRCAACHLVVARTAGFSLDTPTCFGPSPYEPAGERSRTAHSSVMVQHGAHGRAVTGGNASSPGQAAFVSLQLARTEQEKKLAVPAARGGLVPFDGDGCQDLQSSSAAGTGKGAVHAAVGIFTGRHEANCRAATLLAAGAAGSVVWPFALF